MNETEVREAIAQQEEYLIRRKSCSPERWPNGFVKHSWDQFSLYPQGPTYEACFNCRVTKTDEDYRKKIGPERAALL